MGKSKLKMDVDDNLNSSKRMKKFLSHRLVGCSCIIISNHMTMKNNIISILHVLILSLCLPANSWAQEGVNAFQATKVGMIYQQYVGSRDKSFAEGGSGYGAELSVDKGNTFFRYFFKTRIMTSEGKQNFLNSGTEFLAPYKFLQFVPEVGLSFYPTSRRTKGLNVYIWGIGSVSYNNLEISNLPSPTLIIPKDQSVGYGYGSGVGFEFILGAAKNSSYYMVYGEIGFRDERTNLANINQFQVSGLTVSLGFGF